ncbi:hypothetical protein Sste5346_006130 [Sporothrix stenoceras]|uniref:Amidohydrolase-related domain-containing protein n=1 Tax=Sporothrix stenoceras TaxID=5173 RepID=A0ABR3Z3B0_9PEZI
MTSSPKAVVPPGAWDTHTHVMDPEAWPYAPTRDYTPKAALLSEYPTRITGCTSIVVVQASMQGRSVEPLLDTLAKGSTLPNTTLRGLATFYGDDDDDLSPEYLDKLHAAGVRGTRMQMMAWGHGEQRGGEAILERIRRFEKPFARLGWVICVFCPLKAWAEMADGLRSIDPRVKIIADHCGGSFPGSETKPAFQSLLGLLRDDIIHIKLSGLERLYHGHTDSILSMAPIVWAIVEAGPSRIMFGSDWPHTQLGVSRVGKTEEQRH